MSVPLQGGISALVPAAPSFIAVEGPNVKEGSYIPVAGLTEAELYKLGRQWTEALLEKARAERLKKGRP